jgi:uncharacterized protein (DUF2062 family)
MMNRLFNWLRSHWHRLVALHDTPHSIAGGLAIGIILGFTPFYSLKTLLAIGIAWLFRCSKVAAAIAVTLHDITLPLTPFLLRLEYGLGHWTITHPHRWPPKLDFHLHPTHWHEWFQEGVFTEFLWPTFIGSLYLSIPLALVAFFITVRLIERHRASPTGSVRSPDLPGKE